MCNQRTKKRPLYGGRPPFLRYANTGAAFAATCSHINAVKQARQVVFFAWAR
jgi:hypothetical protein